MTVEGGAGRLRIWHDVKPSNDTYITRELKDEGGDDQQCHRSYNWGGDF